MNNCNFFCRKLKIFELFRCLTVKRHDICLFVQRFSCLCLVGVNVGQMGGTLCPLPPISGLYLPRCAGIPLQLRGFPPMTDRQP